MRWTIPYRYVVAGCVFMASSVDFMTRSNINVAIVSMTIPTADDDRNIIPSKCPYSDGFTNKTNLSPTANYTDRYDWSPTTQGVILGSFYYSYIVMQVPAGRLSEDYGGKWIISLSLIGSGIINLLTPLAAYNLYVLVATRLLLGFLQGGLFPAGFAMLAQWFPLKERCFAFSFIDLGFRMGTLIGSSASGYLSDHGLGGSKPGWPSAFYVCGMVGLLAFLFWMPLTKSRPETSRFVSKSELLVIREGSDIDQKKSTIKKVPWKKVFTSGPVVAYLSTSFLYGLTSWAVYTKLPDYLSNVLHMSPTHTGLINSLLPLLSCVSVSSSGYVSEAIIQKGWLARTNCRKVFMSTCLIGSAISIAAIPVIGCNIPLTITALIIYGFADGLSTGGLTPVPSEISRNFPATLFSLSNTAGTMCGFISPYIVGVVLESGISDDIHQLWAYIFYTVGCICFVNSLIFITFGSAERQAWDMIDDIEVLEEWKPVEDERVGINGSSEGYQSCNE